MPAATSAPASAASIRTASPRCRCWPRRCARARWPRCIAPTTPSSSATGWPRRSARASAPTSPCRRPTARNLNAQVVGLFRSGVRSVDESTAYVLVKTAQILAQQTGLVNEIRVRVADPMAAHDGGAAHRARDRLQVGVLAGGARGPAQRLRGPQHHHVHGGRRHPAGGELRHLQHHLHHHAREDARHRHPEVAGPARGRRAPHLRARGADDRADRRAGRLGCSAMR